MEKLRALTELDLVAKIQVGQTGNFLCPPDIDAMVAIAAPLCVFWHCRLIVISHRIRPQYQGATIWPAESGNKEQIHGNWRQVRQVQVAQIQRQIRIYSRFEEAEYSSQEPPLLRLQPSARHFPLGGLFFLWRG